MPPSQERMDADRLLARQLSGSSVMPLGEDIWLHIMKMVRTVKVLWTVWIRRVYYDFGTGMEIGAYDLNLDSTGLEWKLEHTLVGVDPGFFGFLRAELILLPLICNCCVTYYPPQHI